MNDSPNTGPAIEFRNVSYRLEQRQRPASQPESRSPARRNPGAPGPQRLRQNHHPEAHQSSADAERRRDLRRRPLPRRVGRNPPAPHDRICHSGSRPLPAFHCRPQHRRSSADRRLARRSHSAAGRRNCCNWSASSLNWHRAIRANFRADSGRESAWPAPWPPIRRFS